MTRPIKRWIQPGNFVPNKLKDARFQFQGTVSYLPLTIQTLLLCRHSTEVPWYHLQVMNLNDGSWLIRRFIYRWLCEISS